MSAKSHTFDILFTAVLRKKMRIFQIIRDLIETSLLCLKQRNEKDFGQNLIRACCATAGSLVTDQTFVDHMLISWELLPQRHGRRWGPGY